MPMPISFGNMQINPAAVKPAPDAPFRVLTLGDFTGRANRGVHEPLASRKEAPPIAVDCDNLDQVMAKLGVNLELPVSEHGDSTISIRFNELDDFHPNAICDRLDLFQAFKNTRKDLMNPATFESAAAQVRAWGQPGEVVILPQGQPQQPAAEGDHQEEVFQSSLRRRGTGQVQSLLKPVVVQSPDPQQAQWVATVDAVMTKQMRAILHHPDFQSLEAAWRGVDYLARNLETGQHLRLFLFDVTQEELAADLASTDDLQSSGLYSLLAERAGGSADSQPWAVVAGDFTFDATCDDIQTLGRIAKIAAAGNVPFLTAANPHLVGCESLAQLPDPDQWTRSLDPQAVKAWNALRRLDEASHLGVALPRFLMRLPYGQETDAIDRFDLQEIQGNPSDEQYLWGNPVFICAYLLSQSFSQYGWGFTPGTEEEIEDLPAHTFKQDGESKMTPCAQAWLSDRGAETILDKGLMPLLSIQGRDAVKLPRFQSVADPASNLAGRWG